MYIVYLLQSSDGNLYKGMINNLTRRLDEPRRGKTISTRKLKNLRVIYQEIFDNFLEARERELYFKSAAGRRFLKKKMAG